MPKTLATATVDLLLHDARVIITDGQDSYRLVLPLRPVSSIGASFQSGLAILVPVVGTSGQQDAAGLCHFLII